MDKASRAVAAVGKIDAHGIAGIGELGGAHAAVHEAQNFFAAEIIRGLRAQIAARAYFRRDAPALAHGFDLLAENSLEGGVSIASQHALARRQLYRVSSNFSRIAAESISRPANWRSNSAGSRSSNSSSAAGCRHRRRAKSAASSSQRWRTRPVEGSRNKTPIFTHSSRMRVMQLGMGRIPCSPGKQFGSQFPGHPARMTVHD
jgi:hypothetical protein